jgi:hypothetical protein
MFTMPSLPLEVISSRRLLIGLKIAVCHSSNKRGCWFSYTSVSLSAWPMEKVWLFSGGPSQLKLEKCAKRACSGGGTRGTRYSVFNYMGIMCVT